MKIKLRVELFLFSFYALGALAQQCVPPEADQNIKSFENISYKENLEMDLFLPSEGENFPIAFIVHGGSWIAGDRKDFNPFAKQLTGMGYAAVTVSYRLANKAGGKFPGPIEDLRCAVKTLKRRSAEFSLNPDKIMTLGQSAGAHLVADLALTADRMDFNDALCPVLDETPDVQGVIGYFGPYDLRKTKDLNIAQIYILSNFLGGLPHFKKKEAELASPVAQINDEDFPFFLVHASDDDVVPVRSSREFTDALIKSNKDVRYVELSEGKHQIGYFDDRPFAQEATCGTLETLDKFLIN